jgi:hypothetical protein
VTDVPLKQFLWDVTLPAVRAAWMVGQEYIESGKYVPRFEPPSYEENEFGWPSTVEMDRLQIPDTAPVDWSRMFALKPSQYTYVTVEEVPELRSALTAITQVAESDESFASAMNSMDYSGDPPLCQPGLRRPPPDN